jgi:hypothetical protein
MTAPNFVSAPTLVEGDAFDYRADDDCPPHELADGLANVLVVPAEAVNPTNDERVPPWEAVGCGSTGRTVRRSLAF